MRKQPRRFVVLKGGHLMTNRSKLTSIAVGISTFLAGVLAQLIFDKLNNELVIFISSALIMVSLIFVVSIFVFETRDANRQIFDKLDAVTKKFGLTVDYVEDGLGEHEGMTYERTKQIIENAQSSLYFVDFWVQSGDYLQGKPLARNRRKEYYDAIIERIKKFQNYHGDVPFHRRIIQLPSLKAGSSQFNLSADPIVSEHIRDCLNIQSDSQKLSVLKVAPPHIHTHFAIIDQRFVIWPILTSNPRGGGLKRHGIIIFDDPQGQFVQRMMSIYNMIDAVAQPFEVHHLEPSNPQAARKEE